MKPLTQDQIDAVVKANPTNHQQASTALGGSNATMQKFIGGFDTYKQAMGDFSTGVAQSEVKTIQGAATLMDKGVGMLPGKVGELGKGGAAQGEAAMQTPVLQPQGMAQKTGQVAGDTGMFFVPGGAEDTAVVKGSTYIDKIPGLLGMTGKAASFVTNALKTALKGAVSSASMGGVTAAETGGDTNAVKSSAELGGIAGLGTGALETFGPELSKILNKADFKLTPAKEAKTTKIADQAAQFITDNKVVGSNTTKYAKLTNINQKLEGVLQTSLPTDVAVPKANIVDNINTYVESLKSSDPAVYNSARSKADEAIGILGGTTGDMSVKDALSGKRSWGQMAFKMSQKGKIDPTVSNEGAYAVEQAYQKSLDDALESNNSMIKVPESMQNMFGGKSELSLSDFNKVYSQAINAKNLTGLSQFKSDAGLFGRMFGLWVGKTVGQSIMPGLAGEIIGGGIGEVASQALPSAGRNILERSLTHPELPLQGSKIDEGVNRGLQDNNQSQ